jgi:GTPase SAR1 family protein
MQTTDGKEKYDFIFKLVIIGNANCGKSSILHYFVNNKGIVIFEAISLY